MEAIRRGPATAAGQRRTSAVAEEPAVAAACVIYVTDDGEPEMVRKLGDGGEELRKVATADYYVDALGPLSRFRSATVRPRTEATLMGYPPQAFRQGMLGPAGVRDVIEHHRLPTAKPARQRQPCAKSANHDVAGVPVPSAPARGRCN